MVGEPSHVKQLSLNQMCKIGLKERTIKTLKCVNRGDNTPTAATISVMTDGVSLWPCTAKGSNKQKRMFLQISSNTPPVVKTAAAVVGVSSHGL
jgi:hypothetical protein